MGKLKKKIKSKQGMKTWLKALLIALPIVAVLVVGGIVLAATSITAPTSLTYTAPPSQTTMQGFTADNCAAMGTYTTVVLTDNRDSTQYQVRKMPDGKCWMIDNLKLKGGTTLNASNTDLDGTQGTDFVAKWTTLSAPVQDTASHSNGVCTSHSTVTIANGSGYLTCNGASYADTNDGFVAYSDPSTSSSSYENCVKGTYSGTSESSLTGCGYLYNWYTATAGSGTYAKTSDTYATASICPAGWNLPYDDATNDFAVLNNAMATGATASSTSSTATTYFNWFYNGPFMGSLSGNYNAMFFNQGYYGYYWSGRANSATSANNLSFNYNNVNPGNSNNTKNNGDGIRCIL